MYLTDSRTVTHSTFVIERVFPVSAERVFAALSQPEQKRRWYSAGRSTALQAFEMDFRPGGHDRTLYTFGPDSPFPGAALLYETTYLDIVPDSRIVLAYAMSISGRCVSSSLVTFELLPEAAGTTLVFTEQGAYCEGSGGATMREQGWRGLLDRLGEQLAD
jgi:uncharacterized protein YndB with AHSA1/START domain